MTPRTADAVAATLNTALTIAAAHPDSMLPCPACDASTKARNLAAHLEKVHPSIEPTAAVPGELAWRGRSRIGLPARLILADEHLELRRAFGDRGIGLPARLHAAGVDRTKSTPIVPGSDFSTTEVVKAGTYLQIGEGRRAIVVACRQGPHVRKHWAGVEQGRRRRRFHIRLDHEAFVALQYALAARGMLTPR